MLDDQAIRRALVDYADAVRVDAEADLELVLEVGRARNRRHRAGLLLAACLTLLALVGGALAWQAWSGSGGSDETVISPSRLLGSWTRIVRAEDGAAAAATGSWTIGFSPEGDLTVSAPPSWVAAVTEPTGVSYTWQRNVLRTNAFAGELCSGTVGAYAVTVEATAITLRPTAEPCGEREAVFGGRWERAP